MTNLGDKIGQLRALADLVGTAEQGDLDSLRQGTIQVAGIMMVEMCDEIESDVDLLHKQQSAQDAPQT